MDELVKLIALLNDAKVPFKIESLWGGWKVSIYSDEEFKCQLDDCIFHQYSIGYEEGLLESYALIECGGYETANQIFTGWMKKYFQNR